MTVPPDIDMSDNLALKRRKFFVIKPTWKLGRWMYFELLSSKTTSASLSRSSTGMTCCISLRRRRLARKAFMILIPYLRIGIAHLLKSRSCKEAPDSWRWPASCSFSFKWEPDSEFLSLVLLLACSVSDDAAECASLAGTVRTGTGSSRFTKASAEKSSMMLAENLSNKSKTTHGGTRRDGDINGN